MNYVVNLVRRFMTLVAIFLDKATFGKIKPWHVTLISFLGHFFILWYVGGGPFTDNTIYPRYAALALVIFGLMDALDGALARVQKSASLNGMFMDAVSDRAKEIIVFYSVGILIFNHPDYSTVSVLLPILALGTSQLVSYVKAKGEVAVSGMHADKQTLNRLFSAGLARYEIRMSLVVIGFIFPVMPQILYIIIIINIATALYRFYKINNYITKKAS